MEFQRIKHTENGGVELDWTTKKENGEEIVSALKSPQQPLPELPAALLAFRQFVIDLIELPPEWFPELVITSLSIDRKKDGRGLIVTAIRKIEKAHNRPVVINTPRMRESDDGSAADGAFGDEITSLINAVEQAASAYYKGERMQAELFTETPADAPAPPDGDSDIERATRKRRPKPEKGFIPGVGTAVNPDATEPPTDDALHALLLAAARDVPPDAIQRWTSSERDAAQRWAENAVGTARADLPEPECLKRDATPMLLDAWADAAPAPERAD